MRRTFVATLAILATMISAQPARAGTMTYLSIGDSVAFGETNYTQNPSNGDRGFVSDYANYLASQNGGARPIVVNTAIDGETSMSFLTGSNRLMPMGLTPQTATDQTLASMNTNYASSPSTSQNVMFQQAIASAKASGNDVGVVTISLGANDLFQLAASSAFQNASASSQQAQLSQALYQIGSSYALMLAEVHSLLPNAKVYALGEFNPFPAAPSNSLNAFAGPAIQSLNSSIQSIAQTYGATYVDTYTPFVGHEAAYTNMSPTSNNGLPNALGYSVIAAQIEAVPEPSALAVMGLGFAALGATVRRRRNRIAA